MLTNDFESDDEYKFELRPEDNVIIITVNGFFYKGVSETRNELTAYADIIQEFIGNAMKNPKCKEGLWIWKIKNHWNEMEGFQILPMQEN